MNTLESFTVYLSSERKVLDNSATWIAYGHDLNVYMLQAANAGFWAAIKTEPIHIPLRFNEENERGAILIEPVISVSDGLVANPSWLHAKYEIYYWRSEDRPKIHWDSYTLPKQPTA